MTNIFLNKHNNITYKLRGISMLSAFVFATFLSPIGKPQVSTAKASQTLTAPIEKKFFAHDSQNVPQFVEGEVIVKYKKKSLDLKKSAGMKKAEDFGLKKGLEKVDEISDSNIQLFKTPETIEQTLADLKNDPDVEYAQPNFKKFPSVTNTNDPLFPQQWDLSKIQAPLAWDSESPTDADVTVAVLDTGVYYNHADLSQNMWDGSLSCKNDLGANIAGGCPNHGWDYKNNDDNPVGEFWMEGSEDVSSHGTWVSSVLAATPNNSVVMSGMSYYNHIKIMAIRFDLDTISEVKGINFAKNNGAKIINASFGGTDFDQAEKDAIANFPGIFVAAAGNGDRNGNGINNEVVHNYPSDFDNANIISVAATNQNDALASFSNYGATSVDIAAPGVDIPVLDPLSTSSYYLVDGTSFATPLVTGAAALLESKNPSLTNTEIKNAILNSGDQLPINDRTKIASGRRLNLNNNYLLGERTTIPTGVFDFSSETVLLSSTTSGANIFYTTDNSIPTTSSLQYTSPINISETTTIKAIATKSGTINSDMMSEVFYTLPPPSQTHRFRSLTDGRYLYTSDPAEISTIKATLQDSWVDEGPSFNVFSAGTPNTLTAHRFRSLKDGRYLFSADPAEIYNINMTLWSSWIDEGPAFAVLASSGAGTTPAHRFRSLSDGRYLVSADPAEISNINANLRASWVDEGIAFYLPL